MSEERVPASASASAMSQRARPTTGNHWQWAAGTDGQRVSGWSPLEDLLLILLGQASRLASHFLFPPEMQALAHARLQRSWSKPNWATPPSWLH